MSAVLPLGGRSRYQRSETIVVAEAGGSIAVTLRHRTLVTYRSISDPEKLAAYAKLSLPAVTPFGARFLARGNAAIAFESGPKERTVIVEFPSFEKATAAYHSAAY
jgi:uncharacterized protein (DUF1330 family)